MQADERIFSCDDHIDLWALPPDLWQSRMPAGLKDGAPRVVDAGAMKLWKIPRDVGQLGATFLPAGASLRRSHVIHRFLWVPLLRVTVRRGKYFPRFDLCLRTLDFFLSPFIRIARAGNRAFFMRSISHIHPSDRIE